MKFHKRWKKGHSSDCNPKTVRFREAVVIHSHSHSVLGGELSSLSKGRNFPSSGSHKEQHNGSYVRDDTSVLTSFSKLTLDFNNRERLRHGADAALDFEVLSVLEAISEVIKESGGKQTDLERFAILLTMLSDAAVDQTETLRPILHLINATVHKISGAVLQNKFSDVVQRLSQIATASTEYPVVLRHAAAILRVFLCAQKPDVWTSSNTYVQALYALNILLNLATNDATKVRKNARLAVSSVVSNFSSVRSVCECCVNFCTDALEHSGGRGEQARSTMDVLALIQSIIFHLPEALLKRLCETIFKLLTLSNQNVTCSALHCFFALFSHRPSTDILPASLLNNLIVAMFDFAPNFNERESAIAWIRAMSEAFHALYFVSKAAFCNLLGTGLKFMTKKLTDSEPEVSDAIEQCICVWIKGCLCEMNEPPLTSDGTELIGHLLRILTGCCSYQYANAWPTVLRLLDVSFQKLDASMLIACKADVTTCLTLLAELRESDQFLHKANVDKVFCAAISALGPELVLSVVPLGINVNGPVPQIDIPRSWLLPLLQKSIRCTRLAFFVEYFLPVASALYRRLQANATATNNLGSASLLKTLELQIWSLLPSFMIKPMDLSDVLKSGLAQIIGTALLERPDLNLIMLRALRVMVTENCEEQLATLQRYSQNYLPILFNLYTSYDEGASVQGGYDAKGVHVSVLETVRVYLTVLEPSSVEAYLKIALAKIKSDDESLAKKFAILDLVVAMTKYLSASGLSLLYESICSQFLTEEEDARLQKKALRVLIDILQSDNKECQQFVQDNIDAIKEALVMKGSSSFNLSPSAKAIRMNCIQALLKVVSSDDMAFWQRLLFDVVSCLSTDDSKLKRAAARTLVDLVAVGASWKDRNLQSCLDWALSEIKQNLADCCGATDSKEAVSCLVALRLLLFQHTASIPTEQFAVLLKAVLPLLAEERRPVVMATLQLLKTAVSAFPPLIVGEFLDVVVPALFAQSTDCLQHFRLLNRRILATVIRKFGEERISAHVPECQQRLTAYVSKMVRRQHRDTSTTNERKKQKTGDAASDAGSETTRHSLGTVRTLYTQAETIGDLLRDSSDEEGNEDEGLLASGDAGKGKRSAKRNRKPASEQRWLKEDEDVTDLLDSRSVTHKLSSRNPRFSREGGDLAERSGRGKDKTSSSGGFRTAKDGRLIIGGENAEGEDAEDDNESVDSLVKFEPSKNAVSGTRDNKRKRTTSESTGRASLATSATAKQSNAKSILRGGIRRYDESASGSLVAEKQRKIEGRGKKTHKQQKASDDQLQQPYKYLKLDFRALNRRKKAKVAGAFKGVMKRKAKVETRSKKTKRR